MSDHETDIIKTSPREVLLRLAKYSPHENIYQTVIKELYERDTDRLRQDWIDIMAGR